MEINFSKKYVIPFIFLLMLCGTSHEFVHHFTAAAICGCFGYKTFNSFQLCDGCMETHPLWFLATYAGPLFTFGLMWLGLYKLSKQDEKEKQLGFALIFANFPINRILFALLGWNDEQFITKTFFGSDNTFAFWLTNIVIWMFTFPPLIYSFKVIRNKRKILWFIGFFILPLVFVMLLGLLLENWLLLEMQFGAETVLGIPYLIMGTEIVCLAGYFLTKKWIYEKQGLLTE